jgi:quinolinate synthase
MIWHAAKSDTKDEFIVATETGMIYTLKKHAPHKKFYPVSGSAVCEFMKATTLENLLESMESREEERYEVEIPRQTREKAWHAIDRMLGIV